MSLNFSSASDLAPLVKIPRKRRRRWPRRRMVTKHAGRRTDLCGRRRSARTEPWDVKTRSADSSRSFERLPPLRKSSGRERCAETHSGKPEVARWNLLRRSPQPGACVRSGSWTTIAWVSPPSHHLRSLRRRRRRPDPALRRRCRTGAIAHKGLSSPIGGDPPPDRPRMPCYRPPFPDAIGPWELHTSRKPSESRARWVAEPRAARQAAARRSGALPKTLALAGDSAA